MYSPTEERLRTTVEKLATVLTRGAVEVRPGDQWMAVPHADPPLLVYRLADVAVMDDRLLGVTAHEIAELLYTGHWEFSWDASRKPRTAGLVFNVVNDYRIEQIFSTGFPGAVSLFRDIHGPAPAGPWDTKTIRGFGKLPIKWRFLFNIDRALHGLDILGDERDCQAIEDTMSHLVAASSQFPTSTASSEDIDEATQACVDLCEPVYEKLLDLMRQERNEKAAEKRRLQKIVDEVMARKQREAEAQRPDYVNSPPTEDPEEAEDRTGNESDFEHEPAEKDDHMVGGKDGSPGKREKADGPEDGPTTGPEGDSGDDGGGSEGEGGGGQGTETGGGEPEEGGENDLPGEEPLAPEDRLKPTNIVEEMLAEETSTTNTMIKLLRSRHNARAREAKEMRRRIDEERQASWDAISGQLGFASEITKATDEELRGKLQKNIDDYFKDRAELMRVIASLRHHADSVLKDNALERYGGSYVRGSRIKKRRLHRVILGDPRVMERREDVGGKSYAGVLVVDQSASMSRAPAAFKELSSWQVGREQSKQFLAYQTALVFLEAYNEIIETSVVGFTVFLSAVGPPPSPFVRPQGPSGRKIRVYSRKRGRYIWVTPGGKRRQTPIRNTIQPNVVSRTYKGLDQDLRHHRLLVPELKYSHSGTPMWAGINMGTAQLAPSLAQVRFILLVTDGRPTGELSKTEEAFASARRRGIEVYSVFISEAETPDAMREDDRKALSLLEHNSDRVVVVGSAAQIQSGIYRLLKSIVRRRRMAA